MSENRQTQSPWTGRKLGGKKSIPTFYFKVWGLRGAKKLRWTYCVKPEDTSPHHLLVFLRSIYRMFSFESVRNGGSGGSRGNVQASLWNSVVDSWAGWYEQKELSIPCTEFWDTRGQVAVLNHQRQGRCKFYNGQQDHSSNPGALTLRDLWDDWDHTVLSTDDRGYVTCITTTKKSVLPSGRLMSASKMESYSFF